MGGSSRGRAVNRNRLNDRVSQAMSLSHQPSLRNRHVIEPPHVDAITLQHTFKHGRGPN
jgi:RNase P protein component